MTGQYTLLHTGVCLIILKKKTLVLLLLLYCLLLQFPSYIPYSLSINIIGKLVGRVTTDVKCRTKNNQIIKGSTKHTWVYSCSPESRFGTAEMTLEYRTEVYERG